MEFTHEEMLMKIKEGRDLAKNAMELADGMRTEAEKGFVLCRSIFSSNY